MSNCSWSSPRHPERLDRRTSMFRVENYFLPQGLSSAPVTQGDYLMGLITLADIVRVPREQWAFTPSWSRDVPVGTGLHSFS